MMFRLKVGDRIISAETGKMYVVEAVEGTEYKCYDTESHGHTWLLKSMVNEKRFYRWS